MTRGLIAGLLLSGSLTIAGATPAAASYQHCSTHADYTHVNDGYTIARTTRIMGNSGRIGRRHHWYGIRAQYRHYKSCVAGGQIVIIFIKRNGIWKVRAGDYFAPHCATEAQYRRVRHGMLIDEVRDILGHSGKVESTSNYSGYGSQDRSYETCEQFASVVVGFSKSPHGQWHVTAKSGFF